MAMALASSLDVLSPRTFFSPVFPACSFSKSCLQFAPPRCLRPSSIHLSFSVRVGSIVSASLVNRELAEQDSVPPEEAIKRSIHDLSNSILALPADFLRSLPGDLKVDLNDAAFALANGAVRRECGEQMGEVLVQISRALETLDTQALARVAGELERTFPHDSSSRNELGKRLLAAGKRLASTGEYGRGELQKIARALITAGDVLQVGNVQKSEGEARVEISRMYKFGDLQVELTAQRAYSGSLVAFAFGTLSWQLTAALQRVPDSSLQYANDNAHLLATSLKGTLLALGYSCTILSAFTMVGLFILGTQLASKRK